MRVLLLSSFPPDVCGVADYSYWLSIYLGKIGVNVEYFSSKDWGLFNSKYLYDKIIELNPDIVHLQYPTVTYGAGLAPQMVAIMLKYKLPIVITLHEFSQSHILRKVAILPFAIADGIIFTNIFEKNYFQKFVPWIKNKSRIIPIGSNVPFLKCEEEKNPYEVVYFGLIRPNKGLEDFIKLIMLSNNLNRPYTFTIIGTPQHKTREYYDKLRKETKNLPVQWKVNLSLQEIATCLNKAGIAYLPFPDGASERRGSLLACLGNGLAVITTKGPHTSNWIKQCVKFSDSPDTALRLIDAISTSIKEKEALLQEAKSFIYQFSWEAIAKQHLDYYKTILRKTE